MNYDIAQEVNYLRTDEDLYYHYDDFISGRRKIIFVTGISGGGKSTIAEKIANEVNGIAFPLDFFYHMSKFNDTPEMINKYPYLKIFIQFGDEQKYFNIRSDGTRYIDNNILGIGPGDVVFEFIQWILKKEKQLKQPVCIEGVQLHLYRQIHSLIYGNPLVIKSTSTFQSFSRAAKRDYQKPMLIAIFKKLGYNTSGHIQWYLEMTKAINNLIDEYNKYENTV